MKKIINYLGHYFLSCIDFFSLFLSNAIFYRIVLLIGLIGLLSCGENTEEMAKKKKIYEDSLAFEHKRILFKQRNDSIAAVSLRIKPLIDSGSINDIKYYLKYSDGFVWAALNSTGCSSELIFSDSTIEFKMDCTNPSTKIDQTYSYKFGLNPSVEGHEVRCGSCRWIAIYHWDPYRMDGAGWTRGECSINESGHIILSYNGESYEFTPMSVRLPNTVNTLAKSYSNAQNNVSVKKTETLKLVRVYFLNSRSDGCFYSFVKAPGDTIEFPGDIGDGCMIDNRKIALFPDETKQQINPDFLNKKFRITYTQTDGSCMLNGQRVRVGTYNYSILKMVLIKI